ncbi:MAG: flagellar FliJ family protein [Phycisphaerales bacterium]
MSRGFVFELETVLEQRRRQERVYQLAVAELETRRRGIEEMVAETHRRIAAGRDELRQSLTPTGTRLPGPEHASVNLTAVRLSASSSLHGLVLLQRAAIELAGVHERLKLARARLLTATTARKAVETLRGRRKAEYDTEQKRRESAEMDDLSIMRFGRSEA